MYYTASGIIKHGGRPVHRLIEESLCSHTFNPAGFVTPGGCITLIQFYLGVLVLVYLLCLFCNTNFDVLLTVLLSIILVIDQLNARILVL